MNLNTRTQLVCVYSLYVFAGMLLIGFLLAGFIPPPSPASSPEQIADFFRDHVISIRIGMLLCIVGSALLIPWGGAVVVQLKRIEGRYCPLVYAWIAALGCLAIEFIYPSMFWAVAAFRTDGAAELTQRFNDLAWLSFMGILSTAFFQAMVQAFLTLTDKRPKPIFPRWSGYFMIWAAILFAPASLIIFFKDGPLAWNGVISWWLVITAGFAWLAATTVVTARAIKQQAIEPDIEPEQVLTERMALLEHQLAALMGTDGTPAHAGNLQQEVK